MEDVQAALLVLDRAHPGFAKSYKDFDNFLNLTLQDLEGKMVCVTTQSGMIKSRSKLKHYLNCQKFMLQKHLRRLQKFNEEISQRICQQVKMLDVNIPSSPVPSGTGDILVSDEAPETPEEFKNIEDEFREVAIDCVGLEVSRPSTSSGESYSDQSFDASESVVTISDSSSSPFRKLELDMAKMKRRCKHILDVTDRYCVLNSETDLHLKIDDFNKTITDLGQSPPLSPWTNKSPMVDQVDGVKSDPADPNKLPSVIERQGAMKLTVESFCNHLLVILKTYTKKHSREDSTSAAPTEAN